MAIAVFFSGTYLYEILIFENRYVTLFLFVTIDTGVTRKKERAYSCKINTRNGSYGPQ